MTTQTLHFFPKSQGKIAKNKVVRLKYALFELPQHLLEYRDDLYYLHGGYGGMPAKVETHLSGLEVGMKTDVELSPQEGFGEIDPSLIITGATNNFPPEADTVGARLEGEMDGRVIQFRVTALKNGQLTVDGNHPYAGKHLKFTLEVMEIRTATTQELGLGYALKDPATTVHAAQH